MMFVPDIINIAGKASTVAGDVVAHISPTSIAVAEVRAISAAVLPDIPTSSVPVPVRSVPDVTAKILTETAPVTVKSVVGPTAPVVPAIYVIAFDDVSPKVTIGT